MLAIKFNDKKDYKKIFFKRKKLKKRCQSIGSYKQALIIELPKDSNQLCLPHTCLVKFIIALRQYTFHNDMKPPGIKRQMTTQIFFPVTMFHWNCFIQDEILVIVTMTILEPFWIIIHHKIKLFQNHFLLFVLHPFNVFVFFHFFTFLHFFNVFFGVYICILL